MKYMPYQYKYQLVERMMLVYRWSKWKANKLTKNELIDLWYRDTPSRIVGMGHEFQYNLFKQKIQGDA